MRRRLLLRMIAVSVCLSSGSTRLHCAKKSEQIKMLFGVSTPGGPRNIVLDGGPDLLQRGEGGFDVDVAKLLWPLVKHIYRFSQCNISNNLGVFSCM